jgi:ribosomal protein S18 acetylase RimI-like enzyme
MNNCEINVEIKFVDNWSEDEIVKLYRIGGWWKESYDHSGIKKLIKRSFAFAVVIDKDKEKTIGMGRIISDGTSDAYLQDLIVIPEYRNKGIGKKLVNFLLECCLSKGIRWIGLIAEPNQDGFYSSIGFKPMKDYIPMKYQLEE